MSAWPRGRNLLLITATCGIAAAIAGAQDPSRDQPAGDREQGTVTKGVLTARARLAPRAAAPVAGGLLTVELQLTIEDGWHIYANPAGDDAVRPTAIALPAAAGAKVLGVDYPPGVPAPQPGSDLPALVYETKVTIPVRLQLAENLNAGAIELPLQVRFQACNDRACLAPTTLAVPVKLTLKAP